MLRKYLASLLVVSWVVLSGFDLLEDLRFDYGPSAYARSDSAKSLAPDLKHRVGLANNMVETADHDQPFVPSQLRETYFPSTLLPLSTFRGSFALHKLHHVFLI